MGCHTRMCEARDKKLIEEGCSISSCSAVPTYLPPFLRTVYAINHDIAQIISWNIIRTNLFQLIVELEPV